MLANSKTIGGKMKKTTFTILAILFSYSVNAYNPNRNIVCYKDLTLLTLKTLGPSVIPKPSIDFSDEADIEWEAIVILKTNNPFKVCSDEDGNVKICSVYNERIAPFILDIMSMASRWGYLGGKRRLKNELRRAARIIAGSGSYPESCKGVMYSY